MNQSTLNAFLNQQESIWNYSKIAQEQPRGATPWLRSGAEPEKGYPHPGAGAERSKPMAEQQQLHRRGRAERSCSRFKVRRGGREEIVLLQGKEQWLRFAGEPVKRYPTSEVRETPVRQ